MFITDTQIRETLAGLVAVVEREREGLFDSNKVLCEGAPDFGCVTDPEVAIDIALMDSLVAAGKAAIDELDRRDSILRLYTGGGALA